MKRFMTRHLSLRNHRSYLPLSSSDTQLDFESPCKEITRSNEDITTRRNLVSQREKPRKRRWFYSSRRKKARERETTSSAQDDKPSAEPSCCEPSCCDELEVAVEVSPSQDVDFAGQEILMPSNTSCANALEQDGGEALDTATSIHKPDLSTTLNISRQLSTRSMRRFAICEEIERDIITENGMNLRKSRKNLVIRQVLHDLLLL